MKVELRAIDRHFADFISQQSGSADRACWLLFALVSWTTGQGHICLDLEAFAGNEFLLDGAVVALPSSLQMVEALRQLSTVGYPGEFRPLVLDAAGRLYLHRYWKYEQELAHAVLEMAGIPRVFCEKKLSDGMKRLFPCNDPTVVDWQAVAALAAVRKRFCVISGGPGTGKTSTVVKILALLLEQEPEQHLRIALAAPTGKAAARLRESIVRLKDQLPCTDQVVQQIPTSVATMHRLLGYISGSSRFRYTADNPLPFDLVVVDEASMVDLPLMSKLITALNPDARLILLGDRDQLASVEAGAVLGDLCAASALAGFSAAFCGLVKRVNGYLLTDSGDGEQQPLRDTLVVLQKNYRFGESTRIGMLAQQINAGSSQQSLAVIADTEDSGIAWHDLPGPDALKRSLASEVVAGYRQYLAAATVEEALKLFDAFRVLCAVREGVYGVAGLTVLIEELLAEQGLVDPRSRWYKGRPILITANDYSSKLFNGDVGIVFPDVDGKPRVFFSESGGGVRSVSPVRLPEHQTVYAMTIHKSQGSEFDSVLMLLPDRDLAALTRELVYTGITRARDRIAIWGNKDIFGTAVARNISRRSGLQDALGSIEKRIEV